MYDGRVSRNIIFVLRGVRLKSNDTQTVHRNIEFKLFHICTFLLYVFILLILFLIMSALFMRSTLFYAFLSFKLVIMTNAVQEGERQQTNPQFSAGQHQSVAGSSGTSNHPAPPGRTHLASQTRFIRTAHHGESRYFGLNEAEANSNARNRINSISRQRRGWKSTAENVEIRKEYLKNRMRQRQTNEVASGPTHGFQSRFTAEDHILQSKTHLAKPIYKPTIRRANQMAVSIDHPQLVQQHKITQSQGSAFHKVQPKNNSVGPSSSPTRSNSSNNDRVGSQDEQMAKHFGGWKVPSRKRKPEQ